MHELTLIVAAMRSNMGIGAHGSMPWTVLRNELRYFTRVTTRPPPQAPPGAVNAVIMGRKTWDSIPPRHRPLKDRLNIVVSHAADPPLPPLPPSPASAVVRVASLELALRFAAAHAAAVARIFVIGGAHMYDAALRLQAARRVLLTSIDGDFACDTVFPLLLAPGRETPGWTRRPRDELQAWTGESVDEAGHEEAGTRYEFQMWERVD